MYMMVVRLWLTLLSRLLGGKTDMHEDDVLKLDWNNQRRTLGSTVWLSAPEVQFGSVLEHFSRTAN